MNAITKKLNPSAVSMIRMDHTHVMAAFHQHDVDMRPAAKKSLVDTICLALEVHAQLEEEYFYPALRAVAGHDAVLDKSVPEHAEMRRLIARLRGMDADHDGYDKTFMELMRDVMHHVADEETTLLPMAERLIGADLLDEMGAQMTKRRLQLMAPRAGELVTNTVRGLPTSAMVLAAGAILAGAYMATRSGERQSM